MEKSIVAIQEYSAGNQEVGHMWLATAVFPQVTPVYKILEWSNSIGGNKGRLFLTIPDDKTE